MSTFLFFCFILNYFTNFFYQLTGFRSYLTISSIFWFEIIHAVVRVAKSEGCLNPKIFFCIAESVVEAAAVNPNGIKTILAIGVSTFFINVSNFSCSSFQKISLYFNDLSTFVMSFISLFVSVIPEPNLAFF